MSVVNPYEFLGVTPTSTITEVRRAFFRLSLLCHPDKGGNANDMRTLQSAYDWIVHHLYTVKTHGNETYEEKEEAFKYFLEAQQTEKILSWDEIVKDTLGLNDDQFDELYSQCKVTDDDYTKRVVKHIFFSRLRCLLNQEVNHAHIASFAKGLLQSCVAETKSVQDRGCYHASVQGGYGEYLQPLPEDITAPIATDKSFGRQELTIYHEPTPIIPSRPLGTNILPMETMEDYSTESLCDYRVAYQDANKPLEKIEENMQYMITSDVDRLLQERRTLYDNMDAAQQADIENSMREISLG